MFNIISHEDYNLANITGMTRLHTRLAAAGWIAAGLLLFTCGSAFADTITNQQIVETPSGSDSNVTNSAVLTVFSVTPSFNQFNPALGTLVSATLAWTATGSLTVDGNNEGQAILSFNGDSDTEGWNIYGGSTTVDFSLNGSGAVSLAAVTGTGKVNFGPFAETYQLQQGYFPASFSSGTTSGTFTLTYDYTLPTAPTPEVSSLSYLPVLLFGVVFAARARRKRSA